MTLYWWLYSVSLCSRLFTRLLDEQSKIRRTGIFPWKQSAASRSSKRSRTFSRSRLNSFPPCIFTCFFSSIPHAFHVFFCRAEWNSARTHSRVEALYLFVVAATYFLPCVRYNRSGLLGSYESRYIQERGCCYRNPLRLMHRWMLRFISVCFVNLKRTSSIATKYIVDS